MSLAAALLALGVSAAPVLPADPILPAPHGTDGVDVLSDMALMMTRPFQLEGTEAWLTSAAAAGTAVLLAVDVPLYGAIARNVKWTWRGQSVFNTTLLLGDGLVDLMLFGAFAVGDGKARRTALEGIEALAAAAIVSQTGKHIFRVPRPSVDETEKRFFQRFSDDAFPSGHTMAAFATATVLSSEYPSLAPVAYPLAALVGLSVIKRQWHWPSDVLAGGTIGILLGRGAVLANHRRLQLTAAPGGVGVTGTF